MIVAGPGVNFLIAFVISGRSCSRAGSVTQRARRQLRRHGHAGRRAAAAGRPDPRRSTAAAGLRAGPDRARRDHATASTRCARSSRHTLRRRAAPGCRAATPATLVVARGGERVTLRICPRYDAAAKRDAARLRRSARASSTSGRGGGGAAVGRRCGSTTDGDGHRLRARSSTTRRRARKSRSIVGSYEVTRQTVASTRRRALFFLG